MDYAIFQIFSIWHFFLLSHNFENSEQSVPTLSHMTIRENMKKPLNPWKYGK